MIIASSHDFRDAAKRRLPRFLFDYAEGGAYDEVTLGRNVSDLAEVALRQRVLRDVAEIDLKTTIFGRELASPIVLGPVGISGMYARRGELQAARAAKAAGIPMCLSTMAICSLEDVSQAADPFWFQLYVIRDRGFMRDLIARAKAARAEALVFTVDLPVPGARYRSEHSGMSGPNAPLRRMLQAIGKPRWAWDVGLHGRPHRLGNMEPVLGKDGGLGDYMGWLSKNFDPSIMWKDLDWIRAEWDGPLVIKGILDPEDAQEAAALGANGIVVSNHGGRQLDGVLSSARALSPIAEAVGDKMTVLVDGGVRTGLDVVRMLALGADGVLLGRAWVYALAAQGEAGVAKLLTLMKQEMRVAMTLTGVNNIGAIDRSILAETAK